MTKYCKELTEKLCKHISDGLDYDDAYGLEGLPERTFYMWKKTKPQFLQSIKKGAEALAKSVINNRSWPESRLLSLINSVITVKAEAIKRYIFNRWRGTWVVRPSYGTERTNTLCMWLPISCQRT